jgi:hypothetical protein
MRCRCEVFGSIIENEKERGIEKERGWGRWG